MHDPEWAGKVIIEMIPQGKYVKVVAIDPHTRTEVSIVGDPSATNEQLSRIAANKLHYVMEKKRTSR